MNFVDFERKVMIWRMLVLVSIPSEKLGWMLLGGLPTQNKSGGLQGMVIENIGPDNLGEHDGADQLLGT